MYISHSVMEGQRHNNPLNPRCFCLQRPKVIETDTDRSGTYDFLLVFHSNHNAGLSSIRVIGGVSKAILNIATVHQRSLT